LAQIHPHRRSSDAKRQHRHQALAAGKRFRFAVARGQQCNHFGNGRWAGVFEGRKFHEIFMARCVRFESAETDVNSDIS
jgi:hypothetical protein